MYTLHIFLYFIAVSTRCYGDDLTISTMGDFRFCANRKVDSSSILQTLSVISDLDCARACKNNKKCRSSNFVRGNTEHQCQLLSTSFDGTDSCSDLLPDVTSQVIGMVSHVKSYPTCSYNAMDNPCYFDQPINETCQCACMDGFRGKFCEEPPRDCSDFDAPTGSKDIYLPETDEKLRVVCSEGYMYTLRFFRVNNAFEKYMNLTWSAFKFGFNSYYSHPFWIGADIMHNITTKLNYNYALVVFVNKKPSDLPPGFSIRSMYGDFYLGDESTNYTFHFSTVFANNAKASQTLYDNTQFRAMDYNSDHCTDTYKSSWWYPQNCIYPSPLTGNFSLDDTMEQYDEFYFCLKRV